MKLVINLHETAKEMPPANHSVCVVSPNTGDDDDCRAKAWWRGDPGKIVWCRFLDGSELEPEGWVTIKRITPPEYWYTDTDVTWIEEETDGTKN